MLFGVSLIPPKLPTELTDTQTQTVAPSQVLLLVLEPFFPPTFSVLRPTYCQQGAPKSGDIWAETNDCASTYLDLTTRMFSTFNTANSSFLFLSVSPAPLTSSRLYRLAPSD